MCIYINKYVNPLYMNSKGLSFVWGFVNSPPPFLLILLYPSDYPRVDVTWYCPLTAANSSDLGQVKGRWGNIP